MNDLKAKIAAIARQNYINGNESVELGLFSTRAIRQISQRKLRRSSALLAAMTSSSSNSRRCKRSWPTLAQLKAYEQQVANQERVAQDRRDDADRSRNAAASAKAEIARLIEVSKNSLAQSPRARAQVKKQYEDLQARLMAASGIANAKGTGATHSRPQPGR